MTTQAVLTQNPYWDEVAPLLEKSSDEDDEPCTFSARVRRMDRLIEQGMKQWEQRGRFVHSYAWAIPDPAALSFVAAQLGPCAVEVGAGTGYWAWQLAQLGVDIVAYDLKPPDQVVNHFFCVFDEQRQPKKALVRTWYPVRPGGPESLAAHPDRSLFLCWPPYEEDMALRCLQCYPGQRLVSIGEGEGGCTGNDAFFEELRRSWNLVAEHDIAQWYGINDAIWVYERRR